MARCSNNLISDFGPPEMCENKFPWLQATNFMVRCHSSSRKLIHGLINQKMEIVLVIPREWCRESTDTALARVRTLTLP